MDLELEHIVIIPGFLDLSVVTLKWGNTLKSNKDLLRTCKSLFVMLKYITESFLISVQN